jgi:hypothetical protein
MGAPKQTRRMRGETPLWVRLAMTALVAVVVPVYWTAYGPQNFLWLSDIALFAVVLGLWIGHPLLHSMTATGVLALELLWTLDFLVLLVTGSSAVGLTAYMLDQEIARGVRAISLFHLVLPPLLLWMLYRFGYDRRGWRAQTALALVVLPVTFAATAPESNINWVYGWGEDPQEAMPALAWLGVMMTALPLGIHLPTHLLLKRLFPEPP